MTAIVSLVDTDGSIYMGGDTAGTNKFGDQDNFLNKKVFSPVHAPGFIIGTCGAFRLGQVLRYHFKPPLPTPGPTDDFEAYVATELADYIYRCFKNAEMFNEDVGEGMDGTFLLGYQGNIVHFQQNLQAMVSRRNYVAIGSGDALSHGALFASEGKGPAERVYLALQAAAAFSGHVKEPFEVLKLEFDPTWASSKVRRKTKRVKSKK